jgi:hypothetical protein
LHLAAGEQTAIALQYMVEKTKPATPSNGAADSENLAVPDLDFDEAVERVAVQERQANLSAEMGKIASELGTQPWVTTLMTARGEALLTEIDEHVALLQNPAATLTEVERATRRTVRNIEELARHIEWVVPRESVGRISGTRDAIISLSSMEKTLSGLTISNKLAPSAEHDTAIDDQAEILRQRALTTKEVVKAGTDASDTESQPFADALTEWLLQEPLLNLLDAAQDSAQGVLNSKTKIAALEKDARPRRERIQEFVRMAQTLDTITRQMVSPELEQLRQAEAEGERLAVQSARDQTNPQTTDALDSQMTGDDVRSFIAQLEKLGLDDAAQQVTEAMLAAPSLGLRPANAEGVVIAIKSANLQIQNRIRELILLEVSADRDTPVPPQYVPSVNKYFRSVFEDTRAK